MTQRKHYVTSLQDLNHNILKMGTLVEEAIRKSVKSLTEQNIGLSEKVIKEDEIINQMELDIQNQCTTLIAAEQPVAGDLRNIITVLKIITQLERMGDHAVHIAKAAIRLEKETFMKPIIDIPRMAEIGIEMLREILTAFITGDSEKAIRYAALDDEIDNLHDQITREILTYMMEDPKFIKQSITFLFISRFLERFGDHATNISEWIVYNVTGKHVELNN